MICFEKVFGGIRPKGSRFLGLFLLCLALTWANAGNVVLSTEPTGEDPLEESSTRWNLPLKTAGGQQIWTDHRNRCGFRVQQNSLTNHWRLLDPNDVRRSWGSKKACLQELDKLCPRVTPAGAPTVVLLHGLMRTHRSMDAMQRHLEKELSCSTINFAYASTQRGIGHHAMALREVLEDQPGGTKFQFVGHSMGNIVVRHLVGDLQREGDPSGLLPRMNAMVMLGPPNQGAAIARRMSKTGLFGWVTGRGGMELGPRFEELEKRLATPPFPFAIVAGDVSHVPVQNPLTDGAGDFVVSVDEAGLEGAEEFFTVPRLHSFLMDDQPTQEFTVKFLGRHAR